MKRLLYVLIVAFLVQFSSCEKDDICVAGDTPLLMLGFYDYEEPETEKSVPNLRSTETLSNLVVNTLGNKTTDSLPLRTDASSTTFVLHNNYSIAEDGTVNGNPDTVTFTYSVEEEFLSTACGYIANYNELTAALISDTGNWIDSIAVEVTLVKRDTLTHVKIFH